ncbi:MAG: AraC family transcriptional regulator [Clostridiales bacterium]|nr:AraC family transcriptional regulator [Clostridiales bacterium]
MIITGEKNSIHTAGNKLRYINTVLTFIERRLTEELNPETIAEIFYISRSQLYRDFYACTGHSVKEYIRKRRISNACEKIKYSDKPLSVIADDSGCETIQAFHKQFKSIVGMTPLEYRKGDTYFYFFPYAINEISLAVKVGAETIPECDVKRFYDSCLIGIEDRAIASLGEIKGRLFGRNGKQIGNRLCYDLMTERRGAGKTDLYATCTVNYNEPEINDGWNYLYNIWLHASMFEESGEGYFEEYIFSGGKPRKLKLYLPVKKRKAQQHIVITDVCEMAFITAREKGHNAERRASEKVMAFLQEHHPLIIRNARRFYVCAEDNTYECGVECGGNFRLPALSDAQAGDGLEIKLIPAGQYAVLPDNCLGDISMGAAKMDLWLKNNGIADENEPFFAVYETADGKFDNENICMKIYKRLKFDTNG